MFYLFDQNNSGGFFEYDDSRGIGPKILVEADSHDEAVSIMENIVDFDSEYYCHCCGPRWSRYTWEPGRSSVEGFILPKATRSTGFGGLYVRSGEERRAEVYVHYKNTRVERINEAVKVGDAWEFPLRTALSYE